MPQSPPTLDMIKEVNLKISSIMIEVTLVGTPAMEMIDKELLPIFKKLLSSGAYPYENTKSTELFNWLMQPIRTFKEFYYVVGPWAYYVDAGFLDGFRILVGATALEVLAVKCPVLTGPWEILMWLIMQLIYSSIPKPFVPSEHLCHWIVYMTEDADICPNPYLRIELIFLLKMVKLSVCSPKVVFEAMMRACSNLNSDYLERNCYNKNYQNSSLLRFKSIVNRIKIFEYEQCLPNGLLEFGERLATKLREVNYSRLSCIVYDITNRHGLNPNIYDEPWELQTLIALLNTTAGYAHGQYDKWYDEFSEDCTMYMCKILIRKFKPCYKMPQLIYPTASFLINVMEYAISVLGLPTWDDEWQMPIEIDTSNVMIMDELLQELLTENGTFTYEKSPIWQEVIFRYRRRLKILNDSYGPFHNYPTIFVLMEYV